MSTSSRNRAIVRYNTEESAEASTSSADPSVKRRKNQSNAVTDQPIEAEDIDRIVSDCIKYLLITDHKKTPVKRIDLLKAVVKQMPNRKTIEEIMEKISSQMSEAFAIEFSECPELQNSYILVNKLSSEGLKEAIDTQSISESQLLQTGLLTPVLATIFMSGGTVHEDVIWKFIKKLGFDPNSKTKVIEIENDSNGITIKKLMTELWVRQLYLKYLKIQRSDPIAHEFQWGFRADKEFSKNDILSFVCDVFADGTQPQSWRTQYSIAEQEGQTHTQNEPEIEVIP